MTERKHDEVDRQEKGDGFERNTAGPDRDRSPSRKELNGTMPKQQHDQGEEDAAGMEAPGQHDSCSENKVIVEVDCSRRDGQKSARQQDYRNQQQYASRHKQGFQRSLAPQIQARMIL